MSHPILKDQNYFFPEDFYPPVSIDYGLKCSQGLQIASNLKVLLVGVVRDAEPVLKRNLKCLEHIRTFFKSSSVFLFENDSKDFSKNILDEYAKSYYNVIFETEKIGTRKLADKSLERRINMAYARNKYLEYAKKETLDVLIVLDLDIVGGYSYTGLLNSLVYLKSNTCIGSNSIIYQDNQRLYYDTWAYEDGNNKTEEDKNLLIFHRGQDLVSVNSCFGGMMIYPSSILQYNIKYEDWSCDHVTLHKQLKDLNYEIYLNPSQIVLYSEHYYV